MSAVFFLIEIISLNITRYLLANKAVEVVGEEEIDEIEV